MLQRTLLRRTGALRSSPALSRPSLALRTPQRSSPILQRSQPFSSASPWRQGQAAAEAGKESEGKATETKPDAAAEDANKKLIEAKDKEIADLKDKYLRSVAEFRTLQDRTKREVAAARDFGISAFAKDLLDSVDNFDRAISTVTKEQLEPGSATAHQDLSSLHGGLKMTEGILMNTLKKHGLERYDPEGEKFDANAHEATFMAPQPGKEDGVVFYTQQKGFTLNGRTIRAAKVGVVKNS